MTNQTINIALFVSGNGTNCENIIRYFSGSHTVNIALVLSNNPDAYALKRASRLGVPTIVADKKHFADPDVILPLLNKYHIHFIVLAGFLLMIPDFLVRKYHHRMLNIHPALLPKHGGKGMYGRHVHEAVKADGDTVTGMTVHWVSDVCDGGEILRQYSVPLSPDDTVDDIARKEHELEMRYFPQAIEEIVTSHAREILAAQNTPMP
ncbi:MAG: phosphoribosylglycinamide formyltransferase [Prevotella sp.]|nr:phosphoribosylglycinamide formyltransferase [Prevotella sp.]MDY5258909.1 phosphoribosylglycinamide formyltransferase [Prevotella sp.]